MLHTPHTDPVETAHPALFSPITPGSNDFPESLLTLAKRAIALGFAHVGLSTGERNSDGAPTFWILRLGKFANTPIDAAASNMRYNMNVKAYRGEEPSAYAGRSAAAGSDPFWDVDRIAEWLTESSDFWQPITDAAHQEKLLEHWPAMELASRNGWHFVHSYISTQSLSGLSWETYLEINALNNGYNEEGHPAHRNARSISYPTTSMPALINASITFNERGEKRISIGSTSSAEYKPYNAQLTVDDFTEVIEQIAPWFTPVSLYVPGTDTEDAHYINHPVTNAWRTDIEACLDAIGDTERALYIQDTSRRRAEGR